jgi:hypothetical protein
MIDITLNFIILFMKLYYFIFGLIVFIRYFLYIFIFKTNKSCPKFFSYILIKSQFINSLTDIVHNIV